MTKIYLKNQTDVYMERFDRQCERLLRDVFEKKPKKSKDRTKRKTNKNRMEVLNNAQ